MKTVLATALLGLCTLGTAGLVGCQSNHEGDVKSTFRSQYVTVATDVMATTDVAKQVLMDKGLKNVSGTSTRVDGRVKGQKADGTDVNVYVTKEDNGTQVQVTVGLAGGPDLGAEIAHDIKAKADAMPTMPSTMRSMNGMRDNDTMH